MMAWDAGFHPLFVLRAGLGQADTCKGAVEAEQRPQSLPHAGPKVLSHWQWNLSYLRKPVKT